MIYNSQADSQARTRQVLLYEPLEDEAALARPQTPVAPASAAPAETPPLSLQQRLPPPDWQPDTTRQAPPQTQPVPAAAVAPVAAAAPAAPTASPTEIATLELLLADPLNAELVAAHGGAASAPSGSATAESLVVRYGADLSGRLTQLHRAQASVESHYLQALDDALQQPGAGRAGWTLTPAAIGPGDSGWVEDRWSFDAHAFSRDWAAGGDVLQRAFAATCGRDPLQTSVAYTESAEIATTTLGGIATLALGRWVQDGYAPPVWQASGLDGGALQRVDPGAPPDLHNAQAVWFDPGLGWVTERANIVVKQDFFDQAFPVLVGIGAAWATAGLAAGAGGAVGSATGSAVLGAAAQAGVAALAVSTATQIVINGRIDFGQLVRSTLGGAITGGLMQATGVADALKSAAFATRALAVTGQATVQGAVQELLGGHFKDGFTTGLASGLAGEITTALDAAIGSMQGLSAAESSALRLLARATGSAVRAAANPGDPAQAFGLELLGTLVNDELQTLPAAYELASATPDMLFDNQGRVRTGVVDAQAPVAQQALQLAERLQAMGVPADEAAATAMAAVGRSVGRSVASTPPVALGPDGLDGPGNDAPRIVVTGHELPRDAQGNRYQTDAHGRTLVMLDGGGLLSLGSTVVPVLDGVALPGMSVLRMLANVTPAQAAAALLFVPGNIGQSAPTVDLVDGLRYEPPPPGEVWGRQLELQADGSWLALSGRFIGNPTADGVGFSVLSEDEVRRLRAPISTPAVPPPPYTTLPLPVWLDRPEVLPPSELVAPAGPGTTVTPGAPVQDWRDLVVDRNGRKLGDALEAAGRPQPAPGYVPHHVVLVEGGGADMQAARDRLAALGIDIDSAANGVWLPSHRSEYGSPGAYHERLHNDDYFDAVTTALDRAGNRDEAVAVLRDIGQQLSEGDFTGVRPRSAPRGEQP